jgi:hypothetical protein
VNVRPAQAPGIACACRRRYGAPVEKCTECGNSHVEILVVDGGAVHECQLCGALFGEVAAVDSLQQQRAARLAGVEERIWPIVAALDRLPGIRVVRSHAGDVAALTLPFVQFAVQGSDGIVQLENLAKSLLLAARGHHLHWVVEVEYQSRLVFALKPRPPALPIAATAVRDAFSDLDPIGRAIARDSRLSWWRHPGRD